MGGRGSQARAKRGSAGAEDPSDLVGLSVLKDFFDDSEGRVRPFKGTVIAYLPKEGWFTIRYEDDDMEDVGLKELRELLCRAEGSGATATAAATAAEPVEEGEGESDADDASEQEPESEEEEEDSEDEEPAARPVTRARTTPVAAAAPIAARTRSSPLTRAAAAAPAGKQLRAAPRPRLAPAKRPRRTRYIDSDSDEYESDSCDEIEEYESTEESETEPESEIESEPEEESEEEEEADVEEEECAEEAAVDARPSPAAENRAANAGGSGGAGPAAAAAEKPKPKPKAAPVKRASTGEGKKGAKVKVILPKPKGPLPPPGALPPMPEAHERRVYNRGEEPWLLQSYITIPVSEEEDLSPAAVKKIHDTKQLYYKIYREKTAEEKLRVEGAENQGGNKPKTKKKANKRAKTKAAPETQSEGEEAMGGETSADGGKNGEEEEKKLSQRPDRVTESYMKQNGLAIHQEKRVGHIPGIPVSTRFYGRSEMTVLGLHAPPVAGIDYLGAAHTGYGVPFAVSVVCAGWYEDDADGGAELIYTGEGGNDLLGSRKQVAGQKLERGNIALVGNIQLGIPVRLTRKNKDPQSIYGCVLIYDGLYDVVEWWKETGKSGFDVYKYRMIRRPNQGPLISKWVQYKGVTAPRKLNPLTRTGIVDRDISGDKERVPIHAVNDTGDEELPPCTELARVPAIKDLGVARGISEAKLAKLRAAKYRPTVEYVTEYKFAPGIKRPAPPVVPAEFLGNPHAYLEQLNHGRLPYQRAKKADQLAEALPVVYECGPWAGCPHGVKCPQAVTQRGIKYRLEVFKTNDGRGWGLRSLDMIPQYAFICDYYGDVYTAKDFEKMLEEGGHDGEYSMDMAVRPDLDWQGNVFDDQRRTSHTAEYVVCGLKRRNVAAFINHSCAPNCFVQPVLSDHHDTRMPKISIFASEDIAPFTQLTWDYGEDYARQMGCKCGAVDCISKREPGAAGEGGEDEAGPSGVVWSPVRSPAKRPGPAPSKVAPAVAAVLQAAGAGSEDSDEEMEEGSDRADESEPGSESEESGSDDE